LADAFSKYKDPCANTNIYTEQTMQIFFYIYMNNDIRVSE